MIEGLLMKLADLVPGWDRARMAADSYRTMINVLAAENNSAVESMKIPEFFNARDELAAMKAIADLKEMEKEAKRLSVTIGDKLRSPLEKFEDRVRELHLLLDFGRIDQTQFNRGIAQITAELREGSKEAIRLKRIMDAGIAEVGSQEAFAARFTKPFFSAISGKKSKHDPALHGPAFDLTDQQIAATVARIGEAVKGEKAAAEGRRDTVLTPLLNDLEETDKKLKAVRERMQELFVLMKRGGVDEDYSPITEGRIEALRAEFSGLKSNRDKLTQTIGGIDSSIDLPLLNLKLPTANSRPEDILNTIRYERGQGALNDFKSTIPDSVERAKERMRRIRIAQEDKRRTEEQYRADMAAEGLRKPTTQDHVNRALLDMYPPTRYLLDERTKQRGAVTNSNIQNGLLTLLAPGEFLKGTGLFGSTESPTKHSDMIRDGIGSMVRQFMEQAMTGRGFSTSVYEQPQNSGLRNSKDVDQINKELMGVKKSVDDLRKPLERTAAASEMTARKEPIEVRKTRS